MTNYIQPGDSITLAAPSGGVVTGGVYVIGQLLVVATTTAAQTIPFVGKTTGCFSVTKVGSQAWTAGAIVYYDEGNARFTTTATGAFRAGVAIEAVGSGAGETTGKVRLDGVARINEDT
jgi:predicted RecA/RadA family phage recombinase